PDVDRFHVVEMSSFQIELTPSLEPSVGVLLNISPAHLDRHGTIQHYAALKARLVEAARRPIVGEDDDWCRDICERLRLANRGWGGERAAARAGASGNGCALPTAAGSTSCRATSACRTVGTRREHS